MVDIMSKIIEAIYENGVIKIKEKLRNGERVLVIIKPRERKIKKYFGIFKGKNVDEVIGEIESGSIH